MGKFNFIPGSLPGTVIIEPAAYGDHRGFFMESYSLREFAGAGIAEEFVQDNHSCSRRGVLRGLHYQRRYPQGKLVRVARGGVVDVAVDLRRDSPTFLKWEAVTLSAGNMRQFYIPPGFAHGFLALEDDTHLLYKCTGYYDPQYDAGIAWNDPQAAVRWPLEEYGLRADELILSDKDASLPFIKDISPEDLG